MRRILKLSVLGLAAGALSACMPDEIISTEDIPTAGVRFINAVADTGTMDMRFVDFPESNAHFGIGFRNGAALSGSGATAIPGSQLAQFKPARAGMQRRFKIFMNGGCTTSTCNQAHAMTEVVPEQSFLFEAGRLYTVLLWGYANPTRAGAPAGLPANPPAMELEIYEEAAPTPGPTQVALRVINATAAPVDASFFVEGGTAPGTPQWAAVLPMSRSNYIMADTAQLRFLVAGVTPAAGTVAIVGAPAVTVAPGPFDAIPGTRIAGSAVTAIVWPRTVATCGAAPLPTCSAMHAPQTTAAPSFLTPTITFVWDRRPPRIAGT